MNKNLKLLTSFVLMTLVQGTLTLSRPALAQYQKSDSSFAKRELTDEEFKIQNEFVHEGYLKRQKEALCNEEDNKAACSSVGQATWGHSVADSIIEGVGKAYGMFSMMMGVTYHDKAGKETKGTDICGMIAMATETVGTSFQTINQNAIMARPIDPNQQQLESLYKAKSSHEARVTSAGIQVGGWGSAFVCYVAMTAMHAGGLTGGDIAGHVARMGASGLLAGFYGTRLAQSIAAKNKIDEVIEKLKEKMGKDQNCNPISNPTCYCAQVETKYDAKYCLPIAYQGRKDKPETIVSCVNNSLRQDPECHCKASNTCFDTTFDQLSSDFNLGQTSFAQRIGPVKSLMRGQFDAVAAGVQNRNGLQAAREYLKKANPDLPANLDLSRKQQEIAKSLEQFGVSPKMAALLASQPTNQQAQSFMSRIKSEDLNAPTPDSLNQALASWQGQQGSGRNGSSQVVYFDNAGNGRRGNGSQYDDGMNMEMINKLKKGMNGAEGAGDRTLSFAERAARQAEIANQPSKSIFDILSNRYKLSTWQKFEVIPSN